MVGNEPADRLAALRELGYTFTDMDLWDGWLFLEESSAERIIRDYAIPWFTPGLARVRTHGGHGVSTVEPDFAEFDRSLRFVRLQPIYRKRAWIVLDGDAAVREVIERLRARYSDWPPEHFRTWHESAFEHYYPAEFRENVKELELLDRGARRQAKEGLLAEVQAWLDEDPERGRAALEKSAKEVITTLQEIEAQIE